MRAVYSGGSRRYQSPVYKPGVGWVTGRVQGYPWIRPQGRAYARRRSWAWSAITASSWRRRGFRQSRGGVGLAPLAVAERRRPGLRTRVAVLVGILLAATLVLMALNGLVPWQG